MCKTLGIHFKLPWIILPIYSLRHLSESKLGLDDSGCRASHLNVVNSTSTKVVPLSLRLSILHLFETISSISETVLLTVEDSKFVSEVVQLLGWLTTRDLKLWSFPKSMSIWIRFLLYIFALSSWTFCTL